MTQEAVADRLHVSRSAVSDIEAGKRAVSATELVALADMFGQSLEQLLGLEETRVVDDEFMFRVSSAPVESRPALAAWVGLCEAYAWLEAELGEKRIEDLRPRTEPLDSFEVAAELAEEERSRLGLGPTPAHVLLGVLENRLGVKVFFRDLDEGLSGASVVSSRFGAAILVNGRHSPGRRAFTLAHEYFHLIARGPVVGVGRPGPLHWCDSAPATESKPKVEQLADAFAGRLLMPREPFIERLRWAMSRSGTVDERSIIGVARHFGVSVQAVFVQLAVQKLVPWSLAMDTYRAERVQESIAGAGPEMGLAPERFRRLVLIAYERGIVSRGKVAELLDVGYEDVGDEARRHGGGGADRGLSVTLPD
ncbi:MAG: hypothetical protein MNPFHGCM_02697 [Gemmatimonadaceae bacterium]|nr:hypothetical protein [Gemmatimonadaceae bacterium]